MPSGASVSFLRLPSSRAATMVYGPGLSNAFQFFQIGNGKFSQFIQVITGHIQNLPGQFNGEIFLVPDPISRAINSESLRL